MQQPGCCIYCIPVGIQYVIFFQSKRTNLEAIHHPPREVDPQNCGDRARLWGLSDRDALCETASELAAATTAWMLQNVHCAGEKEKRRGKKNNFSEYISNKEKKKKLIP